MGNQPSMDSQMYRTSEDVISSKVGDEVILLHTESDKAYGLDDTAAFVWELLNEGSKSLDQIASALTNRFDVDRKRAMSDLEALLAHFTREQLIHNESGSFA